MFNFCTFNVLFLQPHNFHIPYSKRQGGCFYAIYSLLVMGENKDTIYNLNICR